jgi:hypothetical protein
VGYVLANRTATMQNVPVLDSSSPVRSDQRVAVSGTGAVLLSEVAMAAEQAPVSGSIIVIELQDPASPTATVFSELGLSAPAILLRNIEGEVTVGGLRTEKSAYPFLVLPVSSYERTFAGMLAWEPDMHDELAPWYPVGSVATATTSTASFSSAQALPFFVDTVIGNRDIRVLRDTNGTTVMVYGYANKQTLIIARDETSFSAIIDRLQAL